MITAIQDDPKTWVGICEKIADRIQKEEEIGRGEIEDCSEAKKKESSSGATCCFVVDSFEDTDSSPTRIEDKEDMQKTCSTRVGGIASVKRYLEAREQTLQTFAYADSMLALLFPG